VIRMHDVALARESARIDSRVSRLIAAPRTSEAVTTALAVMDEFVCVAVEKQKEKFQQVYQQ
jgi:hypothetical protein